MFNSRSNGNAYTTLRLIGRLIHSTMKAIRVKSFGNPEVLRLENNVEIPTINNNQVLIKVHSAGINPVDTYIRAGTYARLPELPYTPGGDAAGTVAKVGVDVKDLKVGQRVFTVLAQSGSNGSYAEYFVADQQKVHPLGSNLTFQQGASIGVPYFTAYRALIQRAHAKPSEYVLVHGASGGVGTAAVQLATACGMKVIGTAGSPTGEQLVKQCGAHYVFSHKDKDYIQKIMEATNGHGIDVVIEMLANVNLAQDLDLLSPNGRVIIVGCRGSIEINPRLLMGKETSIIGTGLFSASEIEMKQIGAAVQSGMEIGWVNPLVDKEYPLEDAAKAHHDIINSSGAKGNLVLNTSQ